MMSDPDWRTDVTLAMAEGFDLNIQKVLEHWPVSFALREFIANALDEQALTGTADPQITLDAEGVGTAQSSVDS
jgi:hypothetical protein